MRIDWSRGVTIAMWGLLLAALAVTFWPREPHPKVGFDGFPEELRAALSTPTDQVEELLFEPFDILCFVPQFIQSKGFLGDYDIVDIADVLVSRDQYLVVLTRGQTVVTYQSFQLRGGVRELPEIYYACHWSSIRKLVLTPVQSRTGEEPFRAITVEPRDDPGRG